MDELSRQEQLARIERLSAIDTSVAPQPVATSVAAAHDVRLDRSVVGRIDKLSRDVARIVGTRQALISREEEFTQRVGTAKGRLSLKAEIDGALETLQKMAHERSVGAFERMLTAIARDVQPGTATSITLDLTSERGMPALSIKSEVGGKSEAITSGALSNVVSTGLRFITLARSGRRRFILLDEADCFIENGDTQNFFNVIDQLARESGIQTVLITHHDLDAFKDRFRIYDVSEVDSNDQWPRRLPELVSPGNMQPSDLQESYFTFVEAENFESYTRATIELSPGVTAICGKNGRGKSSWARVLRGLLLGESSDDNVRHGKPMLTTSLGFSDGRVLTHHRRIKGTPKGEYVLHTPDSYDFACSNPSTWRKDTSAPQPLHHSETARLPEWVPQETGVADVDGINVALWGQLTPIFMLDQPPSKRASLLSIGRESGHLYAMNELYKDDVRSDNLTIKDGEREIAAIRVLLGSLETAPELQAAIDGCRERFEQLLQEQDLLQQQGALLEQIAELTRQTNEVRQWLRVTEGFNGEPSAIERTEGLQVWFERLELAQAYTTLKTDLIPPEEPGLSGVTQIEQWIGDFERASADASLREGIPSDPQMPTVLHTQVLGSLLDDISLAIIDSQRQRLEVPSLPVVQETQALQDLLQGLTLARRESLLPVISPLGEARLDNVDPLRSILDEIERTQQMINSSRAQEQNLMREYDEIDRQIQSATQVLGEHWTLPQDRLERAAQQLNIQSLQRVGEPQKIVCVLDQLHKTLQQVAKEGYAWGLSDALGTHAEREEKPMSAPVQRAASATRLA